MRVFDPDKPFPSHNRNPAASIDPGLFLQCIHCGLCTSTCPTFAELGDENDGPRGRIQLMRTVAEGRCGLTDRMRLHLERCLGWQRLWLRRVLCVLGDGSFGDVGRAAIGGEL